MLNQIGNNPAQRSLIKNPIHQSILSYFYIYIVFEWVFWGYAPFSFQGVSLIRQSLDALFFLYFLITCLLKKTSIDLTGRRMAATGGVVLFSVIMSTILHQTHLFYAIQSVFVVFRYLVILMLPEVTINKAFRRMLLLVFMLQVLIGIIEATGLLDLRSILLPSAGKWSNVADFNPTAVRDGPVGISSTFLNTIDYSLYLISSYIVLFWRKSHKWKWLIACVVLALIVKTESKTSMLVFSLLLLFELHSILLRWSVFFALAVPTVALLVANADLVIFFFNNSLEYSRFGFIVYLLPTFLGGNIMNLFFGIGVDPYVGLITIKHYPHIPQMLLDDNSLLNLKDVFWLAQLFQWGLVGFSALSLFLVSIWKKHSSPTMRAMMGVVLILGCTNQVLEVKIFSFILWVTVKFNESFDEKLALDWK